MRTRIRHTTNLGNGMRMTTSYTPGELLVGVILAKLWWLITLPFRIVIWVFLLPFKLIGKLFHRRR